PSALSRVVVMFLLAWPAAFSFVSLTLSCSASVWRWGLAAMFHHGWQRGFRIFSSLQLALAWRAGGASAEILLTCASVPNVEPRIQISILCFSLAGLKSPAMSAELADLQVRYERLKLLHQV